jgi:hypothetical protein
MLCSTYIACVTRTVEEMSGMSRREAERSRNYGLRTQTGELTRL